jgi:hypothetical protein
MKKLYTYLLLIIAVSLSEAAIAQSTAIKGQLSDEFNNPIANVKVVLTGTNYETLTDAAGGFTFTVPYGDYTIDIKEADYVSYSQKITASQPALDLGKIAMTAEIKKSPTESQVPTITLEEDEATESSNAGVSSALGASRDIFAAAANYTFSVAHFNERGYDDEHFTTLMNGAPMVTLTSGRSIYAWGGLNDVTRNNTTSYGLKASNYTFGGIGGSVNIDTRASRQRRQAQITYSIANRVYENRLMATYGSGLLKGGWAVSASISRRWAQEGYVEGTFYDGWSYYAGIEKIIGNHSISLNHFGVSTINGRATSAVQEAFDLTDNHYYNPLWGYQNGEKRNSAVNNIFTPLTVLSHDWKINNRSSLQTALSYQFGKEKRGNLNWYNAPNPRGDYYRKFPSFIPFGISDVPTANAVSQLEAQAIINNPALLQVNWDELYEVNSLHNETFNGVTGLRANYFLEDKVEDNHNFGFNTIYNNVLSDHYTVSGGLTYQSQSTDYYKQISDLLGADYFVDLNQFAEQSPIPGIDAAQNDLNNPNRVVRVGDKFGYNFTSDVHQSQIWAQPEYKGKSFDAFAAIQVSMTDYTRTGNYRNGVFSEISFGKSAKQKFTNTLVKGGVTYKANGRNYLFVNGAIGSTAPFFEDVFISPDVNNLTVTNPENVKLASVEGGYQYKSPKLHAQAVFYSTTMKNLSHIYHFFNDDLNSFANLAITGIDEVHNGTELAAEATVYKGLNVSAVASIGDYHYTSRQVASIAVDNISTFEALNQTVYSENFKTGTGPQSAYTLGAFYRGKKFWSAGFNVNYFDKMYVRFNPIRRTLTAVDGLSEGEQRSAILNQEELDAQVTLDVFASKSIKLNTKFSKPYRNTYIIINAGINNLLNNQDFKYSGGEQLRFDYDTHNVSKFAPKYTYAYGLNYFISLILRMN